MMVTLSSDHAGIAKELKRLEREIYRVIAKVERAQHVRDYLVRLQWASAQWLRDNPHFAPWDKQK